MPDQNSRTVKKKTVKHKNKTRSKKRGGSNILIYSFVIFLAYPLIIAKRIKGEEELLERELAGYSEYKKKVKYRLVPFVW